MKSRMHVEFFTKINLRNSASGWLLLYAVPLQAWSGPGGSRKLRFPDFMTTAQDGGKVFIIRMFNIFTSDDQQKHMSTRLFI